MACCPVRVCNTVSWPLGRRPVIQRSPHARNVRSGRLMQAPQASHIPRIGGPGAPWAQLPLQSPMRKPRHHGGVGRASRRSALRPIRPVCPGRQPRRREFPHPRSRPSVVTLTCSSDRERTLSVRGSCEASTERAVRSTVLAWPMRWSWPCQSRLLSWLPLRWASRFCTHCALLLIPRIGRNPPHFVWTTRRRGRCRRRMTREALAFASLGARIRLGLRVRSRWSRRHRATWTAPRSRAVPFLSGAQCVKIGPPDPHSHPAFRNATPLRGDQPR